MKSYILFTATLILFSCSNTKKMNQNPENNTNLVNSSDIKIAILGDNNQNSIFTTINNVVLKDNTLEISINYTGGCAKHEFELIGSEMISKSLPPIRSINLIHKTIDEESCKRIMYDTLYFDITNLAYQKTSGSVIKLNLAGWKEQLIYTFK
jgi:hypothetical protein